MVNILKFSTRPIQVPTKFAHILENFHKTAFKLKFAVKRESFHRKIITYGQ